MVVSRWSVPTTRTMCRTLYYIIRAIYCRVKQHGLSLVVASITVQYMQSQVVSCITGQYTYLFLVVAFVTV